LINTNPPLVSVDEARRLLGGRGRGRIYELLKQGSLESVLDGGRRFILTDSIFAFVESLKTEAEKHNRSQNMGSITGEGGQ
jgi:hypothetical protein